MLTSVVRVTTLSAPRLHASRWLSTAAKATQFKVEMLGGKDAGIALFTMDRPDARNALGRQFMAEFRQALDQVRFDPKVRVVILRSVVPKVFCAGADLKERLGMTQPEAAASSRGYRTGFTDLEQLPMPTIAAIEGAALGGGMEMALACDLRIAGAKAILGFPETSLAILPGAGGTQRASRLIGISKAKELIFTSRRLNSEAAEKVGLVDYAVPEGKAYEKALDIAREILPNGPVGVRMAKEAIMRGSEVDIASGMAIENACYAQVIPTKDRIEGLVAFKEKRKPQYTGEYGKQYQYFQQIVAVYESEPDNYARLSGLMQGMQETGQPPSEIVKDLAPAFSETVNHVADIRRYTKSGRARQTAAEDTAMASGDAEKHELNEPWAIWEQREQGKNMSYGDKLFKLCTFSTVEEFWGYWNNIPSPSQVLFDGFTRKKFADRTVEGFAVFKEDIVPEWEDPENKNGGEWSIRKEVGAQELDEFWEKLVLGAIGELIDPGNEVTGVRVIHKNNKKDKKDSGNNYRYEIWLRGLSRAKADEIRNRTMDVVNSGSSGAPWVSNEFVYKKH
ncbi:Methylglutaconyl-CoA hydratase [Phytophthora nicotianae]|nr:Methylglutaconyl-CoA hydratase [Phytophthora nicotianae]